MRHYIVTLLIWWTIGLSAQNLEFSGQFYSESYGQRIIPMSNGNWFFTGKIFPGLWEEEAFTVFYGEISNAGDLFPFTPVQEQDNSNALSVFQKSDSNLLLAVEDFFCGEYNAGIVYEINQIGEIITTYSLPSTCTGRMDIKNFENNFFVNCGHSIFQLFPNGTFEEVISEMGDIQDFIPLYNSLYLIGSRESEDFLGIQKVNGQNNILKTLNLTVGGTILEVEGLTFNKNVVLQRNHLKLFNDELVLIDSVFIQNVDIEFQRLTTDDNSIWVLGKDLENNIYVYGFDYELNLTNSFIIDNNGLIANDLAIQNDQVAIVGTGNSGTFQDTISGVVDNISVGKNFWIKIFDKNNNIVFQDTDVSLDLISINSTDIYEIGIDCEGETLEVAGWKGDFQNIALTITNHGTDILQYCEANLQIYACPTSSCEVDEETLLNQQYDNLNLAPGASIVVPFSDFEAAFSAKDLLQLCMWLSVPNQKIDVTPSDNVFCKYFSDTVIDAVNDFKKETVVNIFPNPVTDLLSIQIKDSFKEEINILVYNNLGQIIIDNEFNGNESEIQLDLKDLPIGIYFLSIENEGLNQIYRIIKL